MMHSRNVAYFGVIIVSFMEKDSYKKHPVLHLESHDILALTLLTNGIW